MWRSSAQIPTHVHANLQKNNKIVCHGSPVRLPHCTACTIQIQNTVNNKKCLYMCAFEQLATHGSSSCFDSRTARIHSRFLAMMSFGQQWGNGGWRSLGAVLAGICCTESMACPARSLKVAIIAVCLAGHQPKRSCCLEVRDICT